MKHLMMAGLFFGLVLCGYSQEEAPGIFQNVTLTVDNTKVKQFEAKLAEHNKTFHGEAGPYQVRVFSVAAGTNTGKYIWSMGPVPWVNMDDRPAEGAHSDHWDAQVTPNLTPDVHSTFWKSELDHSHFQEKWNINKMYLTFYDIKPGGFDAFMDIMAKVKVVHEQKMPEQNYGLYSNEFGSTKEGRDVVFINFFENSSWMADDPDMIKLYEEVHGKETFQKDFATWMDVVIGSDSELWIYRPDLSGVDEKIDLTSGE